MNWISPIGSERHSAFSPSLKVHFSPGRNNWEVLACRVPVCRKGSQSRFEGPENKSVRLIPGALGCLTVDGRGRTSFEVRHPCDAHISTVVHRDRYCASHSTTMPPRNHGFPGHLPPPLLWRFGISSPARRRNGKCSWRPFHQTVRTPKRGARRLVTTLIKAASKSQRANATTPNDRVAVPHERMLSSITKDMYSLIFVFGERAATLESEAARCRSYELRSLEFQ
jgi:hypothetical protein